MSLGDRGCDACRCSGLQGDELEGLQAMFPDQGDLGLHPHHLARLHARACRAHAARHDDPGPVAIALEVPQSAGLAFSTMLRLTLPPTYPLQRPLLVGVHSPGMGAARAGQLAAALQESVDRAFDESVGLAGEGSAAVFLVYSHLTALAAAAPARPPTPPQPQQAQPPQPGLEGEGGGEGEGEGEGEGTHALLLSLDHMRSVGTYTKALGKWQRELGVQLDLCWVLAEGGDTNHSRGTPPTPARPPASLSPANRVHLVVQGPDTATKQFVARVRTRMVDVDSRQAACKERRMAVVGCVVLRGEACGLVPPDGGQCVVKGVRCLAFRSVGGLARALRGAGFDGSHLGP